MAGLTDLLDMTIAVDWDIKPQTKQTKPFEFNVLNIRQGSHRLEKYLNIQDCLEKSLKIKFALKSTGKTLKDLEKSLNFTICRRIQHCFWRSISV